VAIGGKRVYHDTGEALSTWRQTLRTPDSWYSSVFSFGVLMACATGPLIAAYTLILRPWLGV